MVFFNRIILNIKVYYSLLKKYTIVYYCNNTLNIIYVINWGMLQIATVYYSNTTVNYSIFFMWFCLYLVK